MKPDDFAGAKERKGLQGLAKLAQCLKCLAAVIDGGVYDFVVETAQLGAPLLIDFFGALLDTKFVFAPNKHHRGKRTGIRLRLRRHFR